MNVAAESLYLWFVYLESTRYIQIIYIYVIIYMYYIYIYACIIVKIIVRRIILAIIATIQHSAPLLTLDMSYFNF